MDKPAAGPGALTEVPHLQVRLVSFPFQRHVCALLKSFQVGHQLSCDAFAQL